MIRIFTSACLLFFSVNSFAMESCDDLSQTQSGVGPFAKAFCWAKLGNYSKCSQLRVEAFQSQCLAAAKKSRSPCGDIDEADTSGIATCMVFAGSGSCNFTGSDTDVRQTRAWCKAYTTVNSSECSNIGASLSDDCKALIKKLEAIQQERIRSTTAREDTDLLESELSTEGTEANATVRGMDELAERGVTWGHGTIPTMGHMRLERAKPFRKWLYEDGDDPQSMNCWESVLYAAHLGGKVDKEYIKKAIGRSRGAPPVFVQAVLSSSTGNIEPMKGERIQSPIPEGHVVVFGLSGEHVALSTGRTIPLTGPLADRFGEVGHEVTELDQTSETCQRSTIEHIVNRGSAYESLVTWSPFPTSL